MSKRIWRCFPWVVTLLLLIDGIGTKGSGAFPSLRAWNAASANYYDQGVAVEPGGAYNWDPYGYYIACKGRSEYPAIEYGFSTRFNMEVRDGNGPKTDADYAFETFDGTDWCVDGNVPWVWQPEWEWDQYHGFGDPDEDLCDAVFNDFWWWDYANSMDYWTAGQGLVDSSEYTGTDQTWHVGANNDDYDLNIDTVVAYWCSIADRYGDYIEY